MIKENYSSATLAKRKRGNISSSFPELASATTVATSMPNKKKKLMLGATSAAKGIAPQFSPMPHGRRRLRTA